MVVKHGLLVCATMGLVKAWSEHGCKGRLQTGAVMVAGAGRGAGWLAARVCNVVQGLACMGKGVGVGELAGDGRGCADCWARLGKVLGDRQAKGLGVRGMEAYAWELACGAGSLCTGAGVRGWWPVHGSWCARLEACAWELACEAGVG